MFLQAGRLHQHLLGLPGAAQARMRVTSRSMPSFGAMRRAETGFRGAPLGRAYLCLSMEGALFSSEEAEGQLGG